MKSGHKGVFTRTSGRSLPIKQLYGPSVPQMIKMKNYEGLLTTTRTKRFKSELTQKSRTCYGRGKKCRQTFLQKALVDEVKDVLKGYTTLNNGGTREIQCISARIYGEEREK